MDRLRLSWLLCKLSSGPTGAGISWDCVAPLSQERLDMLFLKSSAVSCHQGPPPGVIPARWEAKLWGSSRTTRSRPTAQHYPCWEHSSSYVAFAWTLSVSCLCHIRSSVPDGLVYSMLSQITPVAAFCRWFDVPEHFFIPLDPGGGATCAAGFHSVRGELGTCLSLAGRKQPLASGFRHVGLLAWKIVPGLYNSEAGDWGVTI